MNLFMIVHCFIFAVICLTRTEIYYSKLCFLCYLPHLKRDKVIEIQKYKQTYIKIFLIIKIINSSVLSHMITKRLFKLSTAFNPRNLIVITKNKSIHNHNLSNYSVQKQFINHKTQIESVQSDNDLNDNVHFSNKVGQNKVNVLSITSNLFSNHLSEKKNHNLSFSQKKQSPNDNQPKKPNQNPQNQQPKQQPKNPKPDDDPNKKKDFIKLFEKLFTKLVDRSYIVGRRIYNYKFTLSTFLAVCFFFFVLYKRLHAETTLTENQFLNLVDTFKQVQFIEEEFLIANQKTVKKVVGTLENKQKFVTYVASFEKIYQKVSVNPQVKYQNKRSSQFEVFLNQIYSVLDIISLVVIIALIYKSSNTQNIGQKFGGSFNKTKNFQVTKNVSVKFKDVAGLQQSKRQVQQIVDFLTNPTKYHNLGAVTPKGVLLTGPPGTGKTLLAKACAGQAGVPFYSVSGSDFVQVFVGVGASRVRQLFAQAKEHAPSIIFIDELDAVGKKRMNKLGSNDERQSTLNQLLVEMDGFGTNASVIVMAATNRKEILDAALVRAGRFDRQVEVGLPDLKGRFQIFLVHLTPLTLSPKYTKQEYAKRLAALTPGFSGAEIANLCNEAAILAARYNKGEVEMLDFEISSERVIGGVERKGFVSLQEKKTVAFHQCGHAVVSWFLEGADPLLKVTIIPRSKGALGFAQYFINENQLQTKQQLLDRICFILGGRCTQLHFFKQVTTGAYDDLQKAYNVAYQIVAKYGMHEEIGYIAFPEIQYLKPYGQKMESKIDRQIKKIIQECTLITKSMVKQHENHIKNLADQLLKKQTLDVRSIEKILGKRPFPPNKTFQAYLQTSQEEVKQKIV